MPPTRDEFIAELRASCPKANTFFLPWYNPSMSVQEIETIVSQLPPSDLAEFTQWFEEYQADQWDRQIEADALAGRLDSLGQQADREFDAGLCLPL